MPLDTYCQEFLDIVQRIRIDNNSDPNLIFKAIQHFNRIVSICVDDYFTNGKDHSDLIYLYRTYLNTCINIRNWFDT